MWQVYCVKLQVNGTRKYSINSLYRETSEFESESNSTLCFECFVCENVHLTFRLLLRRLGTGNIMSHLYSSALLAWSPLTFQSVPASVRPHHNVELKVSHGVIRGSDRSPPPEPWEMETKERRVKSHNPGIISFVAAVQQSARKVSTEKRVLLLLKDTSKVSQSRQMSGKKHNCTRDILLLCCK